MGNIRGLTSHPKRRMRVTLTSELANALLLPVLSPVCKITETYGTQMIITMDFTTFGLFMAAMGEQDSGQKIGALRIEMVDLNKEPKRVMVSQHSSWSEE